MTSTPSDAAGDANTVAALRRDLDTLPLPAAVSLESEQVREGSAYDGAALVLRYSYDPSSPIGGALAAALAAADWVVVDPTALVVRDVEPDAFPAAGGVQTRPRERAGDGVLISWSDGHLVVRHAHGWLR